MRDGVGVLKTSERSLVVALAEESERVVSERDGFPRTRFGA
jgi:hypothetical protein